MSKFDKIRPYYDAEVNEAIRASINHPMMKAIMNFTFPDVDDEVWKEQLRRTHSIRDFQCNFIYESVQKVLQKSSEGLTTSGFEKLEKNNGILHLSDNSDPIEIQEKLEMSKKSFKKAIGTLYKDKKIKIEKDSILLIDNANIINEN